MSLARISLRTRLTIGAMLGAAITLALLIAAFNLILDARLRGDSEEVLRERAATVLRGLGTTDGRLSVIEAPDQGALDSQTWIYGGGRALEQPAGGDPRNQRAAAAMADGGPAFQTVGATDTRLYALAVRQGGRALGTVVVGASLAPYESTASSALLESVILGALTLAAIGVLSRWLIGRALRPVARMTEQAAHWTEHDLSRRFFTGEPRDELGSLAKVFDDLLFRLAQSLRREQRLTAEISHELRTPLAKIRGEAELASSRERAPTEQHRSLELIGRHARELQGVLETLLASARTTGSVENASSNAREVAHRAAAPLREALAADGKAIELVAGSPARVAVEADLVQRILSPVLENAARFARRQVVLEVRAEDGQVLFEIRDDGPGVDPRELESLFEPGYRAVEQAAGDVHGGAGLGLALARRLARAAGGEVLAHPGNGGGHFTVRLPAA